mmetsp:Transcript_37569/g.111037  ORF Transcript_37569/g.111037 Transcript_37569/m.111037 type:complete len:237 (+) Transcript_37569:1069-1779(+)
MSRLIITFRTAWPGRPSCKSSRLCPRPPHSPHAPPHSPLPAVLPAAPPSPLLSPLQPHASSHAAPPVSQNTLGAPNVYTVAAALGVNTPRLMYMSRRSVASEPPMEWPVNATRANGELDRWACTCGRNVWYSWHAASYTPRCTVTPRESSSNVTGSNVRLRRQWSMESEPWTTNVRTWSASLSKMNHSDGHSAAAGAMAVVTAVAAAAVCTAWSAAGCAASPAEPSGFEAPMESPA